MDLYSWECFLVMGIEGTGQIMPLIMTYHINSNITRVDNRQFGIGPSEEILHGNQYGYYSAAVGAEMNQITVHAPGQTNMA